MKYKLENIWRDRFSELLHEYNNEDKKNYEGMLEKYLTSDIIKELKTGTYTKQQITTFEMCPTKWKQGISILITRYEDFIETQFCSQVDLEAFAGDLCKCPNVRKFTKFCFYLQETVPKLNVPV